MENAILLGVKVKMHTECHLSPGTWKIVGGDVKDYPTLSLLSGCFCHRVTKVHFYLLNPKLKLFLKKKRLHRLWNEEAFI